MSKTSQKEKLAALKAAGVVPKSARWGKESESAWAQLSRAFPAGTIPKQASVLKTSRAAVDTLRGINVPTVSTKYGDFAIPILPSYANPRVKESKNGVHLVWDNKTNPNIAARRAQGINTPTQTKEIILKKGGNSLDHIRYAAKLHRKDKGWSYGRVRETVYGYKDATITGYRLDTAVEYTDPWASAADDRYNVSEIEHEEEKHEIGHDVTALIRVRDEY